MTPDSHDAEGRPAAAGRPPRRSVAGLLALVAALVAGSGALAYAAIGDGAVATAPGAERIEVAFDEWDVATDTREVEAGLVTFAIANDGEVDHELLVLATDTPAGELPQGISGPVPELVGELKLGKPHQHVSTNDSYAVLNRPPDANTKDHLEPGEEIAADVELEPGNYVLYCNLPGHYQRGQYTSLEVTAPETDRS